MDKRFEVCNSYTESIIMDYAKFYCKHGKINVSYIKYIGMSIIGIASMVYILNPDIDLKELIFNPGVFFAILAIFLSYKIPRNTANQLYRTLSELRCLRNTITFYNEHLMVETAQAESKYYYGQIVKLYETEKYLYLYIQENFCHIIDKSRFTTGDAIGLKEFLEKEVEIKVIYKK